MVNCKKSFLILAFSFVFGAFFTGCSNNQDATGSVSFNLDKAACQRLKSEVAEMQQGKNKNTSRSVQKAEKIDGVSETDITVSEGDGTSTENSDSDSQEQSSLILEVSLTGADAGLKTKSVVIGKEVSIQFDELPLGSTVSASAFIYSLDSETNEKTIYFKGTSSKTKIVEAGNSLDIILEKCEVTYTVKHFLQDAEGDGYTEDKLGSSGGAAAGGSSAASGTDITTPGSKTADTLTGTVGSLTQAVARKYTGFTAQAFDQKAIEESGTVVEIYYNRNVHTVTYLSGVTAVAETGASGKTDGIVVSEGEGTEGDGTASAEEITVPASKTYRYGQTVELDFTASYKDHLLVGWKNGNNLYTKKSNSSFVMGDADVTLTAEWFESGSIDASAIEIKLETLDTEDLGKKINIVSVKNDDDGSITFKAIAAEGIVISSYKWIIEGEVVPSGEAAASGDGSSDIGTTVEFKLSSDIYSKREMGNYGLTFEAVINGEPYTALCSFEVIKQ